MSIESTGSPARQRQWHGLALAALLAAFCPLPAAVAATGMATRLPETENEKEVFDAIKNNQFQAAVNALVKAPQGQRVAIAELADEHGMTALHWAARNRNAAGIRWLLDKKADVEVKDDQGRTPLKIAFDNLDTRAMTLLIDSGAMISTALPGHDEKLKAYKKTSDVVNYMLLEFGLAYYEGNGVAKDQARSAQAFAVACEAGYARACHNLGTQYSRAEGVQKDMPKAIALYQKACDGNHAASCGVLGGFHYLGENLPKDWTKAAALLERACNGDSGSSCYLLGMIYGAGDGVAPDKAKAAMLRAKACELGEKKACAAAVAAAPAAKTAAPAAAGSAASPCKFAKVQPGVDTVASVERDIQARGGSPLTGGSGSVGKFRMSAMDGDYADAGPGVMAVNYDFDAAGPAGRLIAMTISRHVDFGAPYAKLVADRKAALTQAFGALKSKSATEHSGSTAGCALTLHENPDGGWLYEIYRLPN